MIKTNSCKRSLIIFLIEKEFSAFYKLMRLLKVLFKNHIKHYNFFLILSIK